jgi:hypothetical protein
MLRGDIKKAREKFLLAYQREPGNPTIVNNLELLDSSTKLDWLHRGHDNALKARSAELRLMAESRVEAIEAKAITEIELSCLKAQEQIAIAGLTSDVARQFIEGLPSVESLMPHLSYAEMPARQNPQ